MEGQALYEDLVIAARWLKYRGTVVGRILNKGPTKPSSTGRRGCGIVLTTALEHYHQGAPRMRLCDRPCSRIVGGDPPAVRDGKKELLAVAAALGGV
jgi:hypothetical protein